MGIAEVPFEKEPTRQPRALLLLKINWMKLGRTRPIVAARWCGRHLCVKRLPQNVTTRMAGGIELADPPAWFELDLHHLQHQPGPLTGTIISKLN
jgi:hypothetical protein